MSDDNLSLEVTGFESFETQLSRLGIDIRTKIMTQALTGAGLVLARAQRESAPVREDEKSGGDSLEPGQLRDDIQVYVDITGIYPTVEVGPSKETGYVGRLLETGHDIVTHGAYFTNKKGLRKHHKSGDKVGHVDAEEWMTPSFEESANDALQKFQDVMLEGIESDGDTSPELLDDFTGS